MQGTAMHPKLKSFEHMMLHTEKTCNKQFIYYRIKSYVLHHCVLSRQSCGGTALWFSCDISLQLQQRMMTLLTAAIKCICWSDHCVTH